ncbi:MAG TPA: pitrilysin family protein [Candidatus Limnocylindria bacterium]|nr:pitrilysin family protein [Candidatus Limnocylindria bacterium]
MRRLGVAVLLGAVLVAAAVPVAAQSAPRRVVLPNGFTVLVHENAVAPVVAVSLFVRMGTRWERPEAAGLSNFVHAAMVKGTTTRSGSDLAEAVAGLGGKISAAGDVDFSEIRGSALARFWRELLALTAELALTPRLDPAEVDRERAWLQSRVQRRRDNPAARAFDELYAAVYGRHPYAIPALGTRQSLAAIDAEAIAAAYQTFYRPERMTLAVSGQVSAAEVVAEAERLFGGMMPGSLVADPPIPAPRPVARRVIIEQTSQQTQIVAGALAPSLDHADHAAVKVLATVLGGGMAGRLFVELRDKSALAYTATAFYEAVREPGVLTLYLGAAPANAARAEEALRREITRVQREPVPAEELARAKGYLLGRYAMDRRTNERQAWHFNFHEVQGVGQDYPARYRRAVEAVTAADVQRVAKIYLDMVTTVVLGPPLAR